MAAVPRLDRGPPGLRQSRRAGLLPRSATAIRRRRGDGARADRALRGLSARHRHPVPPVREPPRFAHRWRATRTCVADDVVPELDTLGRAGRHTNIHRTMARRRAGTTCRAAGHRCCRRRATSSATTGWWSASRCPAARRISAPGGIAAAARRIRATLHAAGFPSRSWTAEDLINWVSALLDPHRQTGDAIPLTYDDGRELRDQVIDRATRLRIDRQGIGLANPAADLQTELRLMSVRSFPPRFALWNAGSPDRRPLPGHAAVPLPVPAHAGRARARRRGHPQLGLPQGRPRHHERHQLHGRFPARPAGAQGRLGHRAQGDGRRPAARRPQPAARALRRAARGDPCRTGGARHLPCARLRTLQRHDDDDAGPHRLAADDALGAVPRRSAAHEARHHQDLGERGAPGAARRQWQGTARRCCCSAAARPDHADRRLRQPGGQLQRGDRRHVGLGQVAAAERDRRRLPRHRRARLDHRRRPLLREGVRISAAASSSSPRTPRCRSTRSPGRGHRRGTWNCCSAARADGVPARVARRLPVLDAGRGDQEGLEGQGPRHDRHRHPRPARDRAPRRRRRAPPPAKATGG